VAGRQAGHAALCPACRECPLVRACGGGLYPHRYRSANGFDNPSVYCDDLKILIPRVIASPKVIAPVMSAPGGDPAAGREPPEGAFDRLSAGPGDAPAMAWLTDSYWSVIRALVATVGSRLAVKAGGNLRRAATDGWQLLSELDAAQPAAVREVLSYPYVQAWAMRCLRSDVSAGLDLDYAHLAGIAAAAALRAGLEAELVLPVRKGMIYLPTVGALAVDPGAGRTSVVRVSSSGVRSRNGSHGWQTVRRVTTGELSITVEDIDPFRDGPAWRASPRLTDAAWRSWRQALAAAALQLTAEVPAYASVIATGLRSVVPMPPGTAGSRRSGTALNTFGALALALPDSASLLAELLVHEVQHVKLTAVSDLFDLFDRKDQALFSVPWRADPRPVEALFHGTYAHLAVADLWRSRSRRAPTGDARQLFEQYRSWVEAGLGTLLNGAALTPAGRRFADGMRATVEGWADDR
ncbi:MAG TPA: HEXXH motif-containing putative peptide modification protein, partial [Trebonia sp.]|nr:HEXXH motif-containing putative peptide modification protein [Trebonia sp.]